MSGHEVRLFRNGYEERYGSLTALQTAATPRLLFLAELSAPSTMLNDGKIFKNIQR